MKNQAAKIFVVDEIRYDISAKLAGDIARVSIIQDHRDSDDSIYFAEHRSQSELEIKRFDPSDNTVGVLLTLSAPKILAFKQLKDFRFLVIDDVGDIKLYSMNAKGDQLEQSGSLHTHPEDREYIV
jgi:hypothetical protein